MKPLLSILLVFLCSGIFAQDRALTLRNDVKSDNSLEFLYEKTDPGTHTVLLEFSTLNNASFNKRPLTAIGYSGRLLTIAPRDKTNRINYSYRYNSIRGKLNPKYDPRFVYLLPYQEGVPLQAVQTSFYRNLFFGEEAPEDWMSYRFYTKEQVKVTAIRKGIVVEIVDQYDEQESMDLLYTSKVNSLTIEHEDGTLAYYTGFEKASFEVKIGDTVFPSTVLGLNTKVYQDRDFYVAVLLYYLKNLLRDPTTNLIAKSGSFYGFITPYFCTDDTDSKVLEHQKIYQAVAPIAVVQKEMSKREIQRQREKK